MAIKSREGLLSDNKSAVKNYPLKILWISLDFGEDRD